MSLPPGWLAPSWAGSEVGALMSSRAGGVSSAPYDSFNVGLSVGDDPAGVAENRSRLAAACGAAPVYLRQVHGARVVDIGAADAEPGAPIHEADASITVVPGVACTVQVADCLPVLFAAPGGRAVGAAHAGWRGLAAGVIEATLAAVCRAGRCRPDEVEAWIGAGIGARAFEVGADVVAAFAGEPTGDARFRVARAGKWLADLPALARDRLARAGTTRVTGGGWCTVEDGSRFFSFRRDRVTGRMAAAVWIVAAGRRR